MGTVGSSPLHAVYSQWYLPIRQADGMVSRTYRSQANRYSLGMPSESAFAEFVFEKAEKAPVFEARGLQGSLLCYNFLGHSGPATSPAEAASDVYLWCGAASRFLFLKDVAMIQRERTVKFQDPQSAFCPLCMICLLYVPTEYMRRCIRGRNSVRGKSISRVLLCSTSKDYIGQQVRRLIKVKPFRCR